MTGSRTAPGRSAAAPPSLPRLSPAERARVAAALLAPLVARGAVVRRRGGVAAVGALDADRRAVETLRLLRAGYGSGPVRADLFGRRTVLLLTPGQVRRVLDGSPEPFTPANREKRGALAHFQPHGVLVSRGPERERRREFTEAALDSRHRVHALADSFLAVVRDEVEILDRALGGVGELTWPRWAPSVWNAVRAVVLGRAARDDRRLTDLLARLRSDANWSFLRPRRARLRARFEERLRGHLDRPDPHCLAGAATGEAPGSAEAAEQVPHWLFAFDAAVTSAFRALALLAAHPWQAEAVRAELDAHNPASVQGVTRLERLRATVLEAVRLWPTTPVVLRDSTAATEWDGAVVPAGTAFVVVSAFFHRDPERLPYADRFAPEIWLDGTAEEDGLVPFSGGPAGCPGRNLVLFTVTALLAALLERREVLLAGPAELHPGRPLPHSLDHFALRLATRPVRLHGTGTALPPPRREGGAAR
ncbi:cytochrome P450 [Thermobifida cellulosilytica]|uniref:cytochrome P450 n=1 Tax=Thermobifida cellulosilytica TaxID=144786 RepID=UPI000AE3697D|nr:cytochrome P450 [Thermobifida cellulosilytica]